MKPGSPCRTQRWTLPAEVAGAPFRPRPSEDSRACAAIRARAAVGGLRRTFRASAALAGVLAALVAGCGRERAGDETLGIRVRVSPTPAAVGPARVMLELEGAPPDTLEAARVSVTATLGEGGVALVESARSEGAALHVVPALVFPTRGEWTLRVRAELPDGRWTEIEHPIRVVGGPPP